MPPCLQVVAAVERWHQARQQSQLQQGHAQRSKQHTCLCKPPRSAANRSSTALCLQVVAAVERWHQARQQSATAAGCLPRVESSTPVTANHHARLQVEPEQPHACRWWLQ